MHVTMKLSILVVATLLIAGCTGGNKTTPTTSSAAATGTVSGVTIEEPMNKASGAKSTVCWTVAGSGKVAHVAIHWATSSQAGKTGRTFADYGAGAAYPDNASALNSAGYTLPGRFCTDVQVPAAGTTYYIVGHAIPSTGGSGMVSTEATLKAIGGGTVTEVLAPSGPFNGEAGKDVKLCWKVKGTGNVAHVAIHWAYQSKAGIPGRTFKDYDKGAAYPDNAGTLSRNGYDLSADGTEFCANARLPSAGTIYVVGHAIGGAGGDGVVSIEKSVTVG